MASTINSSLSYELVKENFTPTKVNSKKEVCSNSVFNDKSNEELINSTSTYYCSNTKEDNEVTDFRFIEATNSKLELSRFDTQKFSLKNIRFYDNDNKNSNYKVDKYLEVSLTKLPEIVKQIICIILENHKISNYYISINSFKVDSNLKFYYEPEELTLNDNDDYIDSNGYLSPETLLGENFQDVKSNVWTTGCFILTIILGNNPFDTESSILTLYKIFKYFGTPGLKHAKSLTKLCHYSPEFPYFSPKDSLTAIEEIYALYFVDKANVPKEITTLISKMLRLESEERITIEDCLSFL